LIKQTTRKEGREMQKKLVLIGLLIIALMGCTMLQKTEEPSPDEAITVDITGMTADQKDAARMMIKDIMPLIREGKSEGEVIQILQEREAKKITRYRVEIGNAMTRGPADAKVTIVEFTDFQCPFCSRVQPTLKKIRETIKRHGINIVTFSIGNIAELAHNGYDMTLYGIDESYWSASGETRKLGSIVDSQTLERFLREFIPGSDQPGDWSDRQTSVYVTKEKKEQIRSNKHLFNSINLIESLKKISNFTPWQERIANKELQLLYASLQKLDNSI